MVRFKLLFLMKNSYFTKGKIYEKHSSVIRNLVLFGGEGVYIFNKISKPHTVTYITIY